MEMLALGVSLTGIVCMSLALVMVILHDGKRAVYMMNTGMLLVATGSTLMIVSCLLRRNTYGAALNIVTLIVLIGVSLRGGGKKRKKIKKLVGEKSKALLKTMVQSMPKPAPPLTNPT